MPKTDESIYSAKKNVLETFENTKPEYAISEMIVDGMFQKNFGFRPYEYRMNQKEKDIQKMREGVDVERQKATKAVMGTMNRIANHSSEVYGQLPPLAEALNKNPKIWGTIKNIKEAGTVPDVDKMGRENEFAGMPLYEFDRLDPNSNKTERMTSSVPELIDAYHQGLPEPDKWQAERIAARTQIEARIKKAAKDADVTFGEKRYIDPNTGQAIYELEYGNGQQKFSYGVPEPDGSFKSLPEGVIPAEIPKQPTVDENRRFGLAERKETRQAKAAKAKTAADYDADMYEAVNSQMKEAKDRRYDADKPDFTEEQEEALRNRLKIRHESEVGKKSKAEMDKLFAGKVVDWIKNSKGEEVPIDYNDDIIGAKNNKGLGSEPPKRKKSNGKKDTIGALLSGAGKTEKSKIEKEGITLIKPNQPLVDTGSFKRGFGILDEAGKKLHSAGVGALKLNEEAGDAIYGLGRRAVQNVVSGQKQARKESLGF